VKKSISLAHAIRLAIGGAAGLGAAFAAAPSIAQEQQQALDEVVITGSRIRQNPLEERLPVMSVTADDYAASGATSIADFIQKLPIAGSAINRTNNSSGNLGFPPDGGGIGAGAAEIDLRYLASKRVLVLVDGRRWVKGSSGSGVSGAVDLNSIPSNAIKSIEILQDGASAVYGSDAIGGVVNIITADDYDTFKISGYTGQYGEGDGDTQEFDVRMGAQGDRGRALVDISYTNQEAVNTADRPTSKFPIPGYDFGTSGYVPAGRFIFVDPVIGDFVDVTPTAGVANPVYNVGNPDSGDFHSFSNADRFNFQPYNHLVTPNERVNVLAKGEYDISSSVKFRALASFLNRKSQGRAAPVPLGIGPGSGSTPYMLTIDIPANQPYNPFGFDLIGSDPDNANYDSILRRPTEAGPRIFDQDVDTWYLSGGFDGHFELGGRTMYWDVTGIKSENNAKQTKHNQFNARYINVALGDPAVCAATPGCVPLDIFGDGGMTREMLNYITYTGVDTSSQVLADITANVTGDLFDLPAGPLGFAIGYEHREEDGSFVPDPVVAAGETADVPTSPTNGGFDVDEVYGEIIVPILKDMTGADSLSFSAAARVSDSSLFNSETSTKFGINWGPTENLMLRASYSEGFRAPNIGELYNLGARFDATLVDRCSNVQPADEANCAALGVDPGYVQINPQISVDTGGNRDLQPETAETFTAGFTWDIPMGSGGIERMLVEGNYYDITVDDAIQAASAQDTLDACIDSLDPRFCDQVHRVGVGTISSIGGVLQNIAGIETDGFDLSFTLTTADSNIGQFNFQLMGSFLLNYDELTLNPATGETTRVSREGTELASPTRGYVEDKVTLNTGWNRGDWSALLSLRYLSSLEQDCAPAVGPVDLSNLCSNPAANKNTMDSMVYTDLQGSWAPSELFGGGWTFTLGVQNLTDESPPICYGCDLNSLDGMIYPIAGQFWYLRASFQN
jgi:iron complex outermembrane receptor protein